MSDPLNLLLIEDLEDDAMLLLRVLKKGQLNPTWERIQTVDDLCDALERKSWDIIISDYTLPRLDAPTALKVVQTHQIDVPFIVISGTIGESTAVEMMKAGAHDYLMKGTLARLPETVRREMREAKVRREKRQVEVKLRRQHTAIEAAIDGISLLQDGLYLYANHSHVQMLGYESQMELLGRPWQMMYDPSEIERFETIILPIVQRDRAWQGEVLALRKDGSTFAQGISLTLTEENLIICVCRDISELKDAQELLLHNSLHDSLTGLPNRKLLIERLELVIARAKRQSNYNYAVLFIDLDRFKIVNDSLGHQVGDQLLIAIAKRLSEHLRRTDMVARLGGDEFVILLEGFESIQNVIHITKRILESSNTPIIIESYELFTSFSIGIITGDRAYNQPADLIRNADIAMYRAKTKSSNSYQFFDTQMHTQAIHRLTLETDLHKALQREEFEVYYQPIFNLADLSLVGFEALIRWQHPSRGFLTPEEFIPTAEETDFIVALDAWVFDQACQQMQRWQHDFPGLFSIKMSVNISTRNFLRASFVDDLEKTLFKNKVKGSSITLEITESMLIGDASRAIEVLHRLKSKELGISIDDFGTGYSSLGYLCQFPVGNIKIDRSFVNQTEQHQVQGDFVDIILMIGQKMNLSVIAEGIETPEQLAWLRNIGCQFGQGYFLSKPLSVEQIEYQYFAKHLV